MKFPNAVVITGSIASGKSSVCGILSDLGYAIISADEISHLMLEISKKEILAKFGAKITDENNKIDRKRLGKIVFSDTQKLKILEQILHPKIRREIIKKCKICENLVVKNKIKTPYFVEIPLYFESKNYECFDQILVIFAPYQTSLDRLKKRNNLNADEAKKRINLQIPIEQKCKKATFIIENCADFSALKQNVMQFLERLKTKTTKKIL